MDQSEFSQEIEATLCSDMKGFSWEAWGFYNYGSDGGVKICIPALSDGVLGAPRNHCDSQDP